MPPIFLTARWHNLLNITYSVSPELLLPHLPTGVLLDVQDGKAFVSLVAFDFLDTRLKGFAVPFHINFPEINLRFYVLRNGERGVCFINEFVPKYAIAWTARLLYNEPYRCHPMYSKTQSDAQNIFSEYSICKNGHTHTLTVEADKHPFLPDSSSLIHYFKEHETGYGITRRGKTLAYHVAHPVWQIYPIKKTSLQIDFGQLYGEKWRFLNNQNPILNIFAQGSEVAVHHPYLLC